MRAIAISLDGVLRKPLDVEAQDFGASLMFASFVEHFRVIVLGTEDPVKDEHFLSVNGLIKYVKIEPINPGDGPSIEEQRVAQVQRLRAEGFKFEFIVVPDPDLAKALYAEGLPVLLYLHPTFSAASFRPDRNAGIRPWDALAAEVDYQLMAKAKQLAKAAE